MTYYDEISPGYDELHKEEQLKKIELIKQFIMPEENERLLDVGCGTGISTSPWNCKRYGIDPSEKLIETARENTGIEFKVGKAEKLPYPGGYFDYVISVTAIQNFDDIEKGLREIRRVGKDKFILTALKKSQKIKEIKRIIKSIFKVEAEAEEEKDLVFVCTK